MLRSQKVIELNSIIQDDLLNLSPEIEENYSEPYHSAINNSKGYLGDFIPNQSGVITDFRSDGDYIRSYALYPYDVGIVIITNKRYKENTIIVLNEDDGVWMIDTNLTWIYSKYKFVSLITEALSNYNENYNEESINLSQA